MSRVAAAALEFQYRFLTYHPSPDLGAFGSRMIIALVAVPIPRGRAKMWLQKGRVAAIPVFGCAEHSEAIMEFLASFQPKLETCACPQFFIEQVQAALQMENYILSFTEWYSVSEASVGAVPNKLGFEVE
jgi:hypothetical protein